MLPTPENATYSGPVLSEEDKRVGEAVSVQEARQAELDEVIRMGTNIEQLIKELCPDGVPYRSLDDMGVFIRGAGIQKSDLKPEGYPAIHYGQIHTYYGLSSERTISFISSEKAEKTKKAAPGDLVIVTTSEDTSAVAKAVAWEGESEVAVSGDALIFKHSLVNKYLSYVFQSGVFQSAKDRLVNGTKVRRVSPKDLGRIRVPVPPVEVQEEIVRILDLFTELEAELEAELEKRRLQYAHYQQQVIFGNQSDTDNSPSNLNYQMIPLKDLGSWYGGSTPSKSRDAFWIDGDIPWVSPKDMSSSVISDSIDHVTEKAVSGTSLRLIPKDAICLVVRSSILDKQLPIARTLRSLTINQDIKALIPSRGIDTNYVYHALKAGSSQILRTARKSGGSVASLNTKPLLEFEIPVPIALDEQRRIADILDQMDALVNDLSSGLPAEIAARRKQYEHYRDRLLSFLELKEDEPTGSTEGALPDKREPAHA